MIKTKNTYLVRGIRLNGERKDIVVQSEDEMSAKKVFDHFVREETPYDYIGIQELEPASHVIQRGKTADGMSIQVEDWSRMYSSIPKNATIGFYPKCVNAVGNYPALNDTFRSELTFDNEEDAWKAFVAIVTGKAKITDYLDKYSNHVIPLETFIAAIGGMCHA